MRKNSNKNVILPPAIEDAPFSEKMPLSKVSPFLEQFSLEEGEDALDPSKYEQFEPEITRDRRQEQISEQIFEDLEDIKEQMAKEYQGTKALPGDKTVPPGKKAHFNNKLIKLCYSFCKLAIRQKDY